MSAAAVAAGAMAVESQNIVGYQNATTVSYKLVTNPFQKIGGSDWTLGDLKPVDEASWDIGSEMIYCYDGGEQAFIATYLNQDMVDAIVGDFPALDGMATGWYDFDEVANWDGTFTCYNSHSLPYGNSAIAVISSTGVRFIGEVLQDNAEIFTASYTLVGNCSPADLTLAEIKPVDEASWDIGSEMIYCYDGGEQAFIATYLNQDMIDAIVGDFPALDGMATGWYDFDEVANWDGTFTCYNSREVDAGDAFAVISSTGVSIPNPVTNSNE